MSTATSSTASGPPHRVESASPRQHPGPDASITPGEQGALTRAVRGKAACATTTAKTGPTRRDERVSSKNIARQHSIPNAGGFS